jgi:hypothetical protein
MRCGPLIANQKRRRLAVRMAAAILGGRDLANANQGPLRLSSVAQRDYRFSIVFTALFALLSIGGTLWYQVPLTLDMSSPLVLLPFLCGPLTLVTGFTAFRGFLRQRKIGTPVLEYSPARLGGMFSGAVVLDKKAEVLGDFTITLNCFAYGERDHNGDRSALSTKAFWSGKMTVPNGAAQTGRFNFTMKLPSGPQLPSKKRETYWQMDVKAPMRGVNFFARFSAIRFY